jgi:hypothetical protein
MPEPPPVPFVVVNQLLLWGLLAVGVPILIHLLMRQRPQRRPWGAMRWLLAALRVAQRRYRLTNLLLLLLRCLIVVLLTLALARPSIKGLGGGGRLVLVVDTTASMGPLGRGPGALDEIRAQLRAATPQKRRVELVPVAGGIRAHHAGSWAEMLDALGKLTADNVPGGLDGLVAHGSTDRILSSARDGGITDVVLVSDFRQDDGAKLTALLSPHVRSVRRWQVGTNGPNSLPIAYQLVDDLVPGQPCTVLLELAGACNGGRLAVDDGIPEPVTFSGIEHLDAGVIRARLVLPPLMAGRHLVQIQLDDPGLGYDNGLIFPVEVRPHHDCLVAEAGYSRLGTVFEASKRHFNTERLRAMRLPMRPLPPNGLLVLREAPGPGMPIVEWVDRGGVLWSHLDLLRNHPDLAPLVATLRTEGDPVPGGTVTSGQDDLEESLSLAVVRELRPVVIDGPGEVLLRAGDHPAVIVVPHGRGWVIVEATDIEGNKSLNLTGGFVEWARRSALRLIQRLGQPEIRPAGESSATDRILRRADREVRVAAGQPLLVDNGLWRGATSDGREHDLIVTANRQEGQLRGIVDADLRPDLAGALVEESGREWSWWVLASLLAVLIVEGAFAAWAGRTYGR